MWESDVQHQKRYHLVTTTQSPWVTTIKSCHYPMECCHFGEVAPGSVKMWEQTHFVKCLSIIKTQNVHNMSIKSIKSIKIPLFVLGSWLTSPVPDRNVASSNQERVDTESTQVRRRAVRSPTFLARSMRSFPTFFLLFRRWWVFPVRGQTCWRRSANWVPH